MQSNNIPSKIPLPFAYAAGGGYINPIPTASQIGINDGRASLHDGFPPDTFTPISSGGVPPFGADFNGILNEVTAITQWQEAGGFFPFDPAFASAVGGYPKNAVIQSSTGSGFWINTSENNSSNPDSGGAGWVPYAFYGLISVAVSGASFTVTNLEAAYPIINLTGALSQNCLVILPNYQQRWIIVNNTSNSFNIQVKTSSGTGVNVPQGESLQIYGDGTNIYAATTAAVSSFDGRTGNVTLNALDVTTALGYAPLNPASFTQSFGQDGYQKLPSGLIIQWGLSSVQGGSAFTYSNFSIGMNFLVGFATYLAGSIPNLPGTLGISLNDYNSVRLQSSAGTTANAWGVFWIALGTA